MKADFRQQEVLLMVNSSFSGRELSVKNYADTRNGLSQKEQLKKACWDGLVPQTLPECFEYSFDKSLFLWEVTETNAFISLEYGEFIPNVEKRFSLNPFLFMEELFYS